LAVLALVPVLTRAAGLPTAVVAALFALALRLATFLLAHTLLIANMAFSTFAAGTSAAIIAALLGAAVCVALTLTVQAGSAVTTWRPVRLVVEDAADLFIARVSGALVVVVAVNRHAQAVQGLTVAGFAFVRIGASIAVVATHPILFPLENAGIGSLLGLLVAPRLLAGMLRSARVLLSRIALPRTVTGVAIRARVAVQAGMPFRVQFVLVTLPRGRITRDVDTVVRVGVLALYLLARNALSALANITLRTLAAVFTALALGDFLVDAAAIRVTIVRGAGIAVVAIRSTRAHTNAVCIAGVIRGALVAIVAIGAGLGNILALQRSIADPFDTSIVLVAVRIVRAPKNDVSGDILGRGCVLLHVVAIRAATHQQHGHENCR